MARFLQQQNDNNFAVFFFLPNRDGIFVHVINDFSSRSFRKRKCLKLVASLKEFRVAITKYVGISIYKIVD